MFKTSGPADYIIHDKRIDIWLYPLHTEFSGAKALLSQDELTRAKRYHFARHQRRFTVARAMMRSILSRYLNVEPQALGFIYNKYGKPELSDTSLQFNLSHSGDYALLAIGHTHPVGIDLELFSARPYEGIGKQLFSATELRALAKAPSMLKPFIFFHIWAQKEAFIKACGLGLSYPTRDFDVPALPGLDEPIIDKLHQKTWQMRSFMPHIACSAALCYHPEVTDIRFFELKNV